MTPANECAVIGKTTAKKDANTNVTGGARFATDIYLREMLCTNVQCLARATTPTGLATQVGED